MTNLHGSQRHSQLILLQPTPFCNINCNYCYLPDRQNSQCMSHETAELIFRRCFECTYIRSPFTFLWHSGEPLSLSPDYYEKAFNSASNIAKEFNKSFDHCFQTNATLINPEWIKLIQSHKVKISISLDGPEFVHDLNRVTHSKSGTHKSAMKGIRMLQDAGISLSAICVLTDFSLDYPDEIYNFFSRNNINYVGFNIDEIEGVNLKSSYSSSDSFKRYSQFMYRFLELAHAQDNTLRVREFDIVLGTLLADSFGDFEDTTNQPLEVISFDYNGNYATFSPELLGIKTDRFDDFSMGNVRDGELDSIFRNSRFATVKAEIERGLKACKESCEYWGFCGGGPPVNKLFEHNRFDSTETLFCRVHKKILADTVLSYIENTSGLQSIST
jgi:uncharacterized protein